MALKQHAGQPGHQKNVAIGPDAGEDASPCDDAGRADERCDENYRQAEDRAWSDDGEESSEG
jgi:hypothetical protein